MAKTELTIQLERQIYSATKKRGGMIMNLPAFSMFVEYVCEECKIKELDVEISKRKCPKCEKWFTVNEEVKE